MALLAAYYLLLAACCLLLVIVCSRLLRLGNGWMKVMGLRYLARKAHKPQDPLQRTRGCTFPRHSQYTR